MIIREFEEADFFCFGNCWLLGYMYFERDERFMRILSEGTLESLFGGLLRYYQDLYRVNYFLEKDHDYLF